MHYEIQQNTLRDGWKNTWFYDEGDGVFQAEAFASRDEAEAALDEFFADLDEDIAAGFSPSCTRDEFRVAFVPGTRTESDYPLINQPTGERP